MEHINLPHQCPQCSSTESLTVVSSSGMGYYCKKCDHKWPEEKKLYNVYFRIEAGYVWGEGLSQVRTEAFIA